MKLWIKIIFLAFFTAASHMTHATGAGGLGLNLVSRSTWWADEWREAGTTKMVRVGGTKRRPKYKPKRVDAPSKDFCGYCNRYWGCNKGAKVTGYLEIVWHHTDGGQSPNLVSMAMEHRAKRFCDIGYHIIIKKNKRGQWAAYQGTPFGYVGSHAGGYNFYDGSGKGSLGIVVAGDYGSYKPDAALIKFMTKVQDAVTSQFRIKDIRSHRDGSMAVNGGHDCPGRHMVPVIEMLRKRHHGKII